MAGEVVLDRVAVELVADTASFRRDMAAAGRASEQALETASRALEATKSATEDALTAEERFARAQQRSIQQTMEWARSLTQASAAKDDVADLSEVVEQVGSSGKSAGKGMDEAERAMIRALRAADDLNPAMSKLVDVIASLAVGGGVMALALVGVQALSLAYRKLTEDAREAKEEQEKAIEALRKLAEARRIEALGPGGKELEDVDKVRERIQGLERDIADIERHKKGAVVGALFGPGGGFVLDIINHLNLPGLKKDLEELQGLAAAGEAAAREARAEAGRDFARQRVDRIERERKAREQAAKEAEQAAANERADLERAVDLRIAGVREAGRLLAIQEEQRKIAEDTARSLHDRVTATERELSATAAINDLLAQRLRDNQTVEQTKLLGRRVKDPLGELQNIGRDFLVSPDQMEAAIKAAVQGFGDLAPLLLRSGESVQEFNARMVERLAAEERVRKELEKLAEVDAVVGGIVSVIDHLGKLDGAARSLVRGLSDTISGVSTLRAQSVKSGGIGAALGTATGIGGALSIAGGVAGIVSAVFNDDARKRIEEARKAWRKSLDAYADELTDRTRWERLQKDAHDRAVEFFQGLLDTAGIDPRARKQLQAAIDTGDLDAISKAFKAFGPDAVRIIEDYNRALERTEEQRRKEIASIQQSLDIEQAALEGNDALAQSLKDQAEIADAVAKGYTDDQIAQLEYIQGLRAEKKAKEEAAQAAEEAAREAERVAGVLEDFTSSLNQVIASVSLRTGDIATWEQVTRAIGEANIDKVLDGFRELVDAGKITQEEFDKLAKFLREDLADSIAQTIEDFRRQQRDVRNDFATRSLAFQGRDRDAFISDVTANAQQQIDTYKDLFDAGVITQREFEAWVDLINNEVIKAIKDFDDAAREAAKAAREAAAAERFRQAADKDRLRIQILLAQGRDAEAAAAQLQLDIQQALKDGRDAEYISLLRMLYAARQVQKQTEDQTRAQEDLAKSIAQTTTALNAPAGLRLSLLRWRALVAGEGGAPSIEQTVGFRRAPVPFSPVNGGADSSGGQVVTQTFNLNGDLTAQVLPGEDPDEWLRRITKARVRKVRAGGVDDFDRITP